MIIWDVAARREIKRHQLEPKQDVWAVSFDPSGSTVAFGGCDKAVTTWAFDTQDPIRLGDMQENITSLDYSPDGQLLSSTTADGVITIWDTTSRQQKYQLSGHSSDAMSAAFTPDGKTLVCVGSEGIRVQFWNLSTGEPTITFTGSGEHMHAVSISPDGRSVAAAQWDGNVMIWKAE